MTEQNRNNIVLGKVLGEIYRIQRHLGIPSANDATIYGLLNGFELAIDDEMQGVGFVSKEQHEHVINVLDAIWRDEDKLRDFRGFYEIETQLQAGGVDRSTEIAVLKYLNASGQFVEIISKMDTSDSPSECRKFDLSEFDIL